MFQRATGHNWCCWANNTRNVTILFYIRIYLYKFIKESKELGMEETRPSLSAPPPPPRLSQPECELCEFFVFVCVCVIEYRYSIWSCCFPHVPHRECIWAIGTNGSKYRVLEIIIEEMEQHLSSVLLGASSNSMPFALKTHKSSVKSISVQEMEGGRVFWVRGRIRMLEQAERRVFLQEPILIGLPVRHSTQNGVRRGQRRDERSPGGPGTQGGFLHLRGILINRQ